MLFKSLSPLNKTALIIISIHYCQFSPSDALCSNQFTAHSLLQAHRVLTALLPLPTQVLCLQCFLLSIFGCEDSTNSSKSLLFHGAFPPFLQEPRLPTLLNLSHV